MYHDGTDLLEELQHMCDVNIVSVDILDTLDVIEKASQVFILLFLSFLFSYIFHYLFIIIIFIIKKRKE